jgi:hypothetical protein
MAYVEWLRVRGCLKWVAIVLGVLFLVGVIVRVALIGRQDYLSWAFNLKSDPGAKVSETNLPDGTRRLAIDDPAKQVRVIVYDRGWHGKRIEIYDYSEHGSNELKHVHVTMGSVRENRLPSGRGTLTVINSNGETDFINYVVTAVFAAFVVATVLGAPFAREGDGHLEIALTKPVSRLRYSIQAMAIDALGIVGAFAIAIVFAIAIHAIFEIPHVIFTPSDAPALVAAILAPIAWYAMLAAATASLRRGYGAVLGFAWPVAGVLLALGYARPNGNVILTVVHNIAWVLDLFNPLAHLSLHHQDVQIGGPPVFGMGYGNQIAVLAVLTILYGALSLVQWRRIEA